MQSRRRKIVHSSLYDTARKSPATIRTRSWGFLPSESLFVSHFMSPSICILSLSQSDLNLDLYLDPTSTHLSMTSTLPSHTSSYAQARCTCTCQKKSFRTRRRPSSVTFPSTLTRAFKLQTPSPTVHDVWSNAPRFTRHVQRKRR